MDDLGKSLKAYLLCGITSVDDYSVYGEMLAPPRALESGVLVRPRVKFAIRFGTPEGHGQNSVGAITSRQLVSTSAQAHAAMKKSSPTSLMSSRPSPANLATLSAIVEGAHDAAIKVFTHTVTLPGPLRKPAITQSY
jgi:hypothetical protein